MDKLDTPMLFVACDEPDPTNYIEVYNGTIDSGLKVIVLESFTEDESIEICLASEVALELADWIFKNQKRKESMRDRSNALRAGLGLPDGPPEVC